MIYVNALDYTIQVITNEDGEIVVTTENNSTISAATQSEVNAGTETGKYVSPATLAGWTGWAGGTEATFAEALTGTGSTQRMSPRRVRQVSELVYSVKAYGAVGDGVADDTQAFIDALAAIPTKGGVLLVPAGDYKVSSQIVVNKNVIIKGVGRGPYNFYDAVTDVTGTPGASNILCSSTSIDLFYLDDSGSETHPVRIIRDLSIINTNAIGDVTAGSAIRLEDNAANCLFEDVVIQGFYNGIVCNGGLFMNIERCRIIYNKNDGIQLNSLSIDNGGYCIKETYIWSSRTTGINPRYGIYYKGGGGVIIDGCNINSGLNYTLPSVDTTQNFQYGIYADFSSGPTSDVLITNNLIENYRVSGIKVDNLSGSLVSHMNIMGNTISPISGSSALSNVRSAIDIKSMNQVVISNNTGQSYFGAIAYPFIKLDTCTNCTIGFNSYENYNDLYSTTNCTNINSVSELNRSYNGTTYFLVTNPSTGTSASAGMRMALSQSSPNANYLNHGILGTNWTTAGLLVAKTGLSELYTDAATNYLISNYNNGALIFLTNARTERMRITGGGSLNLERTVTAGGTTTTQTINKMAGSVNIAAGQTSVTINNSLVNTSSIIMCTILTNDATATIKNAVPTSGVITITLTAATTGETRVGFWVLN